MKIRIETGSKQEVVDITDRIAEALQPMDRRGGVAHLFLLHTTAALTVSDLDAGTDLDLLDAFRGLVPKLPYRHLHDPNHVPDHILSALIGPSLVVPIENGRLALGTWQRVVLLEFDGPRKREILISAIS